MCMKVHEMREEGKRKRMREGESVALRYSVVMKALVMLNHSSATCTTVSAAVTNCSRLEEL